MPIYCYSCSQCNNEFEKLLRMSENDVPLSQPCPTCGVTGSVRQELTAATFGNPITMGHVRTPAGFTQVLDRIHKGSGLKGSRSSKFAETREI